jgi:hypothetical protein
MAKVRSWAGLDVHARSVLRLPRPQPRRPLPRARYRRRLIVYGVAMLPQVSVLPGCWRSFACVHPHIRGTERRTDRSDAVRLGSRDALSC